MLTIQIYNKNDQQKWDDFLEYDACAPFLFKRLFMEYHEDRFRDFSLLVSEDDVLVALLPANQYDDKIFSHQGLTFGGLLFKKGIKLSAVLNIFKQVLFFLKENGFRKLIYKQIPFIYSLFNTEEEKYAFFILQAKLIRTDTSIFIDQLQPLPYQERRSRAINKAKKLPLQIIEAEDKGIELFWKNILIPNLAQKHKAKPVHTVDEILDLKAKFPDQIKHYNIIENEQLLAGTTLFINPSCVHAQYISGNELGRKNGALDYLFHFLIKEQYQTTRYFDFGICNENGGLYINKGLLDWKEGFGGRTAVHHFYEIETINYQLITLA